MACDRFVYFDSVPAKEDVQLMLEDYLGAYMNEKPVWGGGRFTVKLIGNKSWPLRRLISFDSVFAKGYLEEAKEERWIEVYIGEDNIDVITRRQDAATNNLADGFAKLIARYFKGEYKDE